ncbi:hypothetical protein CYMTET_38408 [Cymbomonas tetramitiformis]|uniref:DNA (cytosine-5-)-methyltransferase n=1 Tax=Cymbomonas tetramitiformis TaxID=36881 RepID=A0AAE0F4Z6_9CHLO|nr:hypothetical protein CYMTET_38408 [Cymbomonas tetramitiformis]
MTFCAADFEVPSIRTRVFIIGAALGTPLPNEPEKTCKKPQDWKTIRSAWSGLPHLIDGGGQTVGAAAEEFAAGSLDAPIACAVLYNHQCQGGWRRWKTAPGKMEWDKPAPTVLCKPSDMWACRHPDQDRLVSVRELCRVQTFPDSLRIRGVLSSQYKQVGNSVPCKLGEAVGRELLKVLEAS